MSTCCVPGAPRVETTTRRAPIWSLSPSLGPSPAALPLPNWPHLQMGPDRPPHFPPSASMAPQILLGMWGFWTLGSPDLPHAAPATQGELLTLAPPSPGGGDQPAYQSPGRAAQLFGAPIIRSGKRSGQRVTRLLVSEGLVQGLHLFIFPHRGTGPHPVRLQA